MCCWTLVSYLNTTTPHNSCIYYYFLILRKYKIRANSVFNLQKHTSVVIFVWRVVLRDGGCGFKKLIFVLRYICMPNVISAHPIISRAVSEQDLGTALIFPPKTIFVTIAKEGEGLGYSGVLNKWTCKNNFWAIPILKVFYSTKRGGSYQYHLVLPPSSISFSIHWRDS